MECKDVYEYTIPSFSAITVAHGRSESFYQVLGEDDSAAVTGFIRDTKELKAQIFPTRSAVEQKPFLRASFFLAQKGTVWVRVSN